MDHDKSCVVCLFVVEKTYLNLMFVKRKKIKKQDAGKFCFNLIQAVNSHLRGGKLS